MRKEVIYAALILTGVAGTGCVTEGEILEPSNKVAEATIGKNVKLEIRENEDGSFLATQTGPIGTSTPIRAPRALMEAGDPVALFQHLAPGQPVPESLMAANRRSLEKMAQLRERPGGAPATPPAPPSSGASEPKRLAKVDVTESNWTDVDGCPAEFFDRNWCANSDKPFCRHDVVSAFLDHDRALSGWGAVCSQSGQLTFRITRSSTVDEFTVDQGSWRTAAMVYRKGTCGWFTCEDVRYRLRFELVERPEGSYGHFASHLDL